MGHCTQIADTGIVACSTEASGFEPVLNIPALGTFLAITAVFVSLQVRIVSIQEAAEACTNALRTLKVAKAKELEGAVSHEQVEEALIQYRRAFDTVERLRNVAPGVRIAAPPSSGPLSGQSPIASENLVGARRFLGLTDLERETYEDEAPQEVKQGLPIPLLVLLGALATSLLLLLGLLSVDPMESSGNVVTAVDDWSGLE